MEKKTLISIASVVVLLIAALVTFYLMKSRQQAPIDLDASLAPSYGTDNPLDKKPDLNPADKTNPFADIKTNPFE